MRKKTVTLFTALILLCFLGFTSAFAKNQVNLVYVKNNSSDIASTYMVKTVLEKKGYIVNLMPTATAELMWEMVANGLADGMLSAWLPTIHKAYFEQWKDKVEYLGPNLNGTKGGLVVPNYVTLDSIGELKENAEQFNRRIIGLDLNSWLIPDTQKAISGYRLNDTFQLFNVGEQAMLTLLEDAIQAEQWIVVTGWRPHWKFSRWKLKYLDDPLNAYSGQEYIATIVRKGLKEDMPAVYNILDKFHWTPADMETVMGWNSEGTLEPETNAKRWVQMNPDKTIIWTARSAYTQRATYDLKTGMLILPEVDIVVEGASVGAYQVSMQKFPDSLVFNVIEENTTPLDSTPIRYGAILQRVFQRGYLTCGIRSNEQKGFTFRDESGRYSGFDVDLCRAVAAGLFNNPNAIRFIGLKADERGEALQAGRIDILARQTTWTSSREAQWGDFTWIMFYDGQGFMVRTDSGISTLEQLDGKTICVTAGTTTELNLRDTFKEHELLYTATPFSNQQAMYQAYQNGQCTAVTTDKSQLAAIRSGFSQPEAHTILDITVSKEPLTPVVPHGDSQWFDVVKTVMMGLINAEELGISQANIEEMMSNPSPAIKRLLGVQGSYAQSEMGLRKDQMAQVIRAVGNYADIYERHLGTKGINIPRGPNRLWQAGGLLYAPPLR